MSKRIIDYTGQIIGHLRVKAKLGSFKGQRRWICECDCGNITTVTSSHLSGRGNISCGCASRCMIARFRGTHGKTRHPNYRMWISAKERAQKAGLPFEIEIEDIIIPDYCPYLEIKLQPSGKRGPWKASPSLDRIKPELGYVKGNIQVISHKANGLKGAATFSEMELLVNNWKKQIQL